MIFRANVHWIGKALACVLCGSISGDDSLKQVIWQSADSSPVVGRIPVVYCQKLFSTVCNSETDWCALVQESGGEK